MLNNVKQKIKQAVRVETQYAPAPASLTIISCKYENRRILQQFTT